MTFPKSLVSFEMDEAFYLCEHFFFDTRYDIDITAISEERVQAVASHDLYSASIMLTPAILNLPAPLRDIPEQLQPRTLFQFHDVRELRDISVTA